MAQEEGILLSMRTQFFVKNNLLGQRIRSLK